MTDFKIINTMFLSENNNNNNINIIQPFANNQYQGIFNYNGNQYAINLTFNKDGSSATYSIGYDLDNFIYTSSNISIIQDSLTTNYYGVLNTENNFETNDFTVNFIEFNFDSNYTILTFVEKTTMYMSQNAWNKLNFIYPSEYQTFVNWQYSSSNSLNQIILDPTLFISQNPYLVLKGNLIFVQIKSNIPTNPTNTTNTPNTNNPIIYNISLNNNLYSLDYNQTNYLFNLPFSNNISPPTNDFIIVSDNNGSSIKYVGTSPIKITFNYSMNIKETINLTYKVMLGGGKATNYIFTDIDPIAVLTPQILCDVFINSKEYSINSNLISYPFQTVNNSSSNNTFMSYINYNLLLNNNSFNIELNPNDIINLNFIYTYIHPPYRNMSTYLQTIVGPARIKNYNAVKTLFSLQHLLEFTNFNFQLKII